MTFAAVFMCRLRGKVICSLGLVPLLEQTFVPSTMRNMVYAPGENTARTHRFRPWGRLLPRLERLFLAPLSLLVEARSH